MSIAHALKWSFLSEMATRAVQPVVFIVLTRLLTPEEFGVMTAALMVIAFSQIFWEAGMGKALIQRQTDFEAAANAAFWTNLALGILIACLLYFLSNNISILFFKDSRVAAVLQIMTLQVLFGALSSIQTAILQKDFGFKKLFWVRLTTIGVPGLASIPLAWNGFGYWSLVTGTLIGQALQVIVLWHMSPWRPKLEFDRRVTKEMLKFGSWVGATGLLVWFYAWADSLIVGHYLGSGDLGLYRTGGQFPSMIFVLLFGPILPVLYSMLSKLGNDPSRQSTIAATAISTLTLVSIPIAITLFAYSKIIEDVIFGQAWAGIGMIIGAMALMHGFSWIVGMNGEFYRAMGKPSYETIVTGGSLAIYLFVYILTINIGLEVFVWARTFLAIGALVIHVLLLKHITNINITKTLGRPLIITLACGISIYLSKAIVTNLFVNEFAILIIGLTLAALTTSILIYATERNRTIPLILNAIRNKQQ